MRKLFFEATTSAIKTPYVRQEFRTTVLDYLKTQDNSILKGFQKVYKASSYSETRTFSTFVSHVERQNKNRTLLYRGMSTVEVTDLFSKNKFLNPQRSTKQHHYNIPEHVIRNNSSKFGSFTLSLEYGGTYASRSTVVPSSGAIVETNLPPYFINPKELLATHEELFDRYSKRYEIEEREQAGEFQGLTNVHETAGKNSEITMIRDFGKHYCGLPMNDVRAVHLLTIPGDILCKWTSITTPLHETTIVNPHYKQRVCSVQVGFAEHDAFLKEEYELLESPKFFVK